MSTATPVTAAQRLDWPSDGKRCELFLGGALTAATGFLIARDPEAVPAPDASFVAQENDCKLAAADACWLGTPDLLVDPKLRTDTCNRSATDATTMATTNRLDGDGVVREFHYSVEDIFGADETTWLAGALQLIP